MTGDTKVVPRQAMDRIFINTTGIGYMLPQAHIQAQRLRPGDSIIVSGTIGDHGLTILSARENLLIESLLSDSASIYPLVASLFEAGIDPLFLRDPTRGGVAAVLHELAEDTQLSMLIDESSVPLSDPVRGASELLGLDPLFIANEGKIMVFVRPEASARCLDILRQHPLGQHAARIGEVVEKTSAPVIVRNAFGSLRVLDEPQGAFLPRIC